MTPPGSQHPEPPFIQIGQFCTAFYFSFFLVLVPLIGFIENTLFDLATKESSLNSHRPSISAALPRRRAKLRYVTFVPHVAMYEI